MNPMNPTNPTSPMNPRMLQPFACYGSRICQADMAWQNKSPELAMVEVDTARTGPYLQRRCVSAKSEMICGLGFRV